MLPKPIMVKNFMSLPETVDPFGCIADTVAVPGFLFLGVVNVIRVSRNPMTNVDKSSRAAEVASKLLNLIQFMLRRVSDCRDAQVGEMHTAKCYSSKFGMTAQLLGSVHSILAMVEKC